MSLVKKNKKGFITAYAYFIFLWVTIISWTIIFWYITLRQLSLEALYSMKSFYSAETWVEEALLSYKKNPVEEEFIWEDRLIDTEKLREVEYKDQNVYRKELVIEEVIPAWKSIQLFFNKEELHPNITKFHIWFLPVKSTPPTNIWECWVTDRNAATEIWAFQRANIITTTPLDYNVPLSSNWNGCYSANNITWKRSIVYYTDPYSNEKFSYIWDKCVLNNKWNVSDTVFEENIPYVFNDNGTADDTDNSCNLNCWTWLCSIYYTKDQRITPFIQKYLKFYTIAPNIVHSDLTDDSLIAFDVRAVDEDSHIMIWATDNEGNAYDIPWRYINVTSTWISSQNDLKEWLFTRLSVKKKANTDLLPIFDWALYSESEFIK